VDGVRAVAGSGTKAAYRGQLLPAGISSTAQSEDRHQRPKPLAVNPVDASNASRVALIFRMMIEFRLGEFPRAAHESDRDISLPRRVL
jgi:hypothetical protein